MTTSPPRTSPMTSEEMLDSLTGYEEIAISQTFDADIFTLADTAPTTMLRALVFVDQLRYPGVTKAAAKDHALSLTLGATQDYFTEDNEPTPETPVTEPGKGAPQHAKLPVSSPHGAY